MAANAKATVQVYRVYIKATPQLAAMVGGEIPAAGGGWSYILSDLKTLLETGKSLRESA